ncbi:hypothetical protein [Acanthamoeba polyphaga mimivirus]|uniref:Uncharacterized protein n=1 Tax=Acanthamoeba polyphaga mimivirus TaxID=212035 RepID=A0A2L2DHX9_MIMIV|nr:hypothetical protein [Acanthamoeba polyphaga mimivirus]
MNDQPNDNKITNTTIQKKSDNDQLKITINYSKMNCPKTNDLKMNEKEICDENDSDENDSDENDSNQFFTKDQCLMGAYNHLCDMDKEMIKIIESRKNLFTPIPIRYKYIGVEYEYEHPSVRDTLRNSNLDILPKYSFSTLFDKYDTLNSMTHLIFGDQYNIKTPKKATTDADIEDLIYTETSCKKCQKSFIKGRCVVNKVGITCGHCGHHCKHGKLQEITKKTKHNTSKKH